MTRKQAARALEKWRARLAPEWRITVYESGPDWRDEEDYLATVQCDDDYAHAKIHLTDACLARDDESVEVTIVHEILHLLTRELRRVLDRGKGYWPPSVHDLLSDGFEHDEEALVDRLAHAIVRSDRQAWPASGLAPGVMHRAS